jgi:ribosomal protein L11 methylase PrmA
MFSDPVKNIAELGIMDGMRVVDLGAGSGFYSIEAAKKVGTRGMVYAVDVQRDLLDRVKKNGSTLGLHNIEGVWGNAEKIGGTKLRESVGDRVIASNILFQIEESFRDDFCLEIKRIHWSEQSALGPRGFVSADAAKALFEKAGFVFEKDFDAGDHHYGLIFIKKQ